VIKENLGIVEDFIIYDISNPSSIATTSATDLGGGGFGITVSGRYAYVAQQSVAGNDLRIFDVADPINPVEIGGVDVETNARAVVVSGTRVYIGVDATGANREFRIFDLTGIEVQSALVHSLEAGNVQVRNDLIVSGRGAFDSLNTGLGGIFSRGPLSTFVASTTQTTDLTTASFMGGNVGIGTTSPYTLLSVSGDAYFDGNITAANVTATGTLSVTGLTTVIQASSTRLSVFDTAYFGGTATTTIDSAGNITLAGTITTGGDSINEFAGTGLTVSGNALTADLGTSITSAEITDDTIVNADINSSAAIAISKTALIAGTNITLSTNTLNVDDAFLVNNADDTTTGQLTALNFVASSASATSTFAGGLDVLAINQTGTATSTFADINRIRRIGNIIDPEVVTRDTTMPYICISSGDSDGVANCPQIS